MDYAPKPWTFKETNNLPCETGNTYEGYHIIDATGRGLLCIYNRTPETVRLAQDITEYANTHQAMVEVLRGLLDYVDRHSPESIDMKFDPIIQQARAALSRDGRP